jgi:hypothetical protein
VGLGSIWFFNWQVAKQLTYEDDWEEDDGAYFIAHDTPSDGNCLFSAISLSRKYANGSTPLDGYALHQSANTLRMAAVGYLRNRGSSSPTPPPFSMLGEISQDTGGGRERYRGCDWKKVQMNISLVMQA